MASATDQSSNFLAFQPTVSPDVLTAGLRA
jgi:hypothetical protein